VRYAIDSDARQRSPVTSYLTGAARYYHAEAMTVLSDRSIKDELAEGHLSIEPLDPQGIQPASVDLRLDRAFRTFRVTSRPYVNVRESTDDLTELVKIGDDEPFILQPHTFCLGSTIESVTLPDDIVARVDGKSSLGRLGLLVHATAGYVDPGWTGCLTLELSNQSQMPIALYYAMRIAQISFLKLSTPAERPYGSSGLGSKYQGQTGPTPSRIAQEFGER
jgi:dCTP deaminase